MGAAQPPYQERENGRVPSKFRTRAESFSQIGLQRNSRDVVAMASHTLGISSDAPLFWYAMNSQRLRERTSRMLGLCALRPMRKLRGFSTRGHRLGWSLLAGLSEDRWVELGKSYAKKLLPAAERTLEQQCQGFDARGPETTLRTDLVRPIAEPLAEALGFGALECTEIEVRSGRCTGKVLGEVQLVLAGDHSPKNQSRLP